MEKITINKKSLKYVEIIDEIDMYQSIDGMVFDNIDDCLKRDEYVKFQNYFEYEYKLKNINLDFFRKDEDLIKCDLIYINGLNNSIDDICKYYNLENKNEKFSELNIGWFFIFLYFSDLKFKLIKFDDIIKLKENELEILKNMLKN